MRIYAHSTVPWGGSSYSVLARRVIPEWVRLGHEVCLGTWYGLQGQPQKWNIHKRRENDEEPGENGLSRDMAGMVLIMPCLNGATYGTDTLLGNYEMYKADVCISIMDVWVLPADLTRHIKFAPWLPVDHDPVPQPVVESCRTAIYPMSFSRWGVEKLRECGIEATYVPCSADSNVFKPGDKMLARRKLGVPDECDFLAIMVAANKDPSDRKGFGEGILGFAQFAQSHPNAYLHIHTDWNGQINIGHLAERAGIIKQVAQPNPLALAMGMYDWDYMRDLYVAADVLLNPAKSEGFGLPLLEAQMCGTPIASSDFSTTDELLYAGWKIRGQRHWSYGADSWRLMVYVDSVTEVLEEAYANRNNELLRVKARNGAIELDTETVAKRYWKPALEAIEGMVKSKGGKLELVTF